VACSRGGKPGNLDIADMGFVVFLVFMSARGFVPIRDS